MVDNALLDQGELGFEEWAVTPTEDHLTPDSVKREQKRQEFIAKLREDPPAIVISHNDADGLGAPALIQEMYGTRLAILSVSYNGPYGLEEAVEDAVHHVDSHTDLFITDLNPDPDSEIVRSLDEYHHGPIVWFDHHQWDDEMKRAVETAGVELHLDEEECATSLVARDVNHEFREEIQELAEVTKDIDLWIRDDPRSERLNVLAFMLEADEYISLVQEHGVDWPQGVDDEIDEQLSLNERLEDLAVEQHTDWKVNGYDVAFTYIRGGRSSTIGNRLVEEHDPLRDIAVVMRPTGCSIYSHSDNGTFERCHEVAGKLGGGGHPTASGFGVPVDTFRQMADYWASKGNTVQDEILSAIKEVVEDE